MARNTKRMGRSAAPASPPAEDDERGQLGEAFVAALRADFEKHGHKAIVRMRLDKPDQYFKAVAAFLPKEIVGEGNSQSEPRRIIIQRRIVHVGRS